MLKEQLKLVELATQSGNTSSEEVSKLQRRLVLSKNFRMLAVQRVVTNAGGKTAGIDKILLKTDEAKWETVK